MASRFSPENGTGIVLERCLSVKAAAKHFGYKEAYLRRLLREGRLQGTKIGQVWLIKLASLEAHLQKGLAVQDRHFGSQRIATEAEMGCL